MYLLCVIVCYLVSFVCRGPGVAVAAVLAEVARVPPWGAAAARTLVHTGL